MLLHAIVRFRLSWELLQYRVYIDTLPAKDILCGFVSSIDDLRAWERGDSAQLILDTKQSIESLQNFVLR